jgi:transposase
LLADAGYDSNAIRNDLAARNITAVIPGRPNRRMPPHLNQFLYAMRNAIERCFAKMKWERRVATRYDKLGSSFLAFVTLTIVQIWFRFVNRA